MTIQDNQQVFVIVADCGGGDDENPHITLQSALARIEPDETGVEIYEMTFAEYRNGSEGQLVWRRW